MDYQKPGPLTSLEAVGPALLAGLGDEPARICRPVHWLVLQPGEASGLGLPPQRLAESQIRPAGELVAALLRMVTAPLTEIRAPRDRVVGTCRHFAVLSCALLRRQGIAARAPAAMLA
jgi:hypothetical protein